MVNSKLNLANHKKEATCKKQAASKLIEINRVTFKCTLNAPIYSNLIID